MVNNIKPAERMNISDRQKSILDLLEKRGGCSYQELIEFLKVSNMTIRRDVDRLAEQGVVIKTLGGIQKVNAPAGFYESNIQSRLTACPEEKRAIAYTAWEEIQPGQTIFLDGSTTCLELARVLVLKSRGLTIVTNSALMCLELGRSTENRVVGIGGQYDPASLCFVGPSAEEEAGKFFVDRVFISTKGFLPAEGTFESSIANFRIKQIICERCAQVTLLVDHTKFGKRALCKVLDISQIHTVITDDKTTEGYLALLKEAGKIFKVAALEVSAHVP